MRLFIHIILSLTKQTMDIVLREHQIEHFKTIRRVIGLHRWAVDSSLMGCGKTFIALKLAQSMGLPIIVVCTVSLVEQWKELTTEYQIETLLVLTYGKLTGVRGHNLKHPLLTRTDDPITEEFWHEPTDMLNELTSRGVLIVFDESHNVKNDTSARYRAARALVGCAMNSKRSRVLMLSATPFDKMEHAKSLTRLLGLWDDNLSDLFTYCASCWGYSSTARAIEESTTLPTDLANLIGQFTDYDLDLAMTTRFNKDAEVCYEVLSRVIVKYFFHSMPPPLMGHVGSKPITIDMKNAFCIFSDDSNARLYSSSLNKLSQAVRWDGNHIRTGTINWGLVSLGMMGLELSKIKIFTRLALSHLRKVTNGKVVIFLSYSESLETISESLSGYGVVILRGSVSQKDRNIRVNEFQTASGIRVLVTNIRVGAFGVDLHDTVGGYPRLMIISPSYNMTEQSQAPGRCWRDGTRSNVIGRVVYGEVAGESEINIFKALDKKSSILKTITKREYYTNNGKEVPLPSDYDCVREVSRGFFVPRQKYVSKAPPIKRVRAKSRRYRTPSGYIMH